MERKKISDSMLRSLKSILNPELMGLIVVLIEKDIITEEEIKNGKNFALKELRRLNEEDRQSISDGRYGC